MEMMRYLIIGLIFVAIIMIVVLVVRENTKGYKPSVQFGEATSVYKPLYLEVYYKGNCLIKKEFSGDRERPLLLGRAEYCELSLQKMNLRRLPDKKVLIGQHREILDIFLNDCSEYTLKIYANDGKKATSKGKMERLPCNKEIDIEYGAKYVFGDFAYVFKEKFPSTSVQTKKYQRTTNMTTKRYYSKKRMG